MDKYPVQLASNLRIIKDIYLGGERMHARQAVMQGAGKARAAKSRWGGLQPALDRLGQFVDCHGVIGAVVVTGDGVKIGVTDQVLIGILVAEKE